MMHASRWRSRSDKKEPFHRTEFLRGYLKNLDMDMLGIWNRIRTPISSVRKGVRIIYVRTRFPPSSRSDFRI
jgi:hypothetical protein